MKYKISNDSDYKISRNYNSYKRTEWGFEGTYYHWLGMVNVYCTQDLKGMNYLMLTISQNGREYHRTIKFYNNKPTFRMAGLLSKRFIEEKLL